jgi:ribonuclease P protein component
VRAERRGAGDPLVRVQVRLRADGEPRIGFAVSRRVVRNRTRRRLRALCDRELAAMKPVDVVVIPTAAAAPASFPELGKALHRVLGRAGAL